MIQLRLDKKRKRFLACGIILLLFGLGYRFWPASGIGDTDSDISLKLEKMGKYQELIREKEVLEKDRGQLLKMIEKNKDGLLTGSTAAIAAVSMQDRLKNISKAIGVDIKSTRVMETVTVEDTNLLFVPVEVSMELTIRQLEKFLYKIESSGNIYQIKSMKLRRKSETPPIHVTTTITVGGYMMKSAGNGGTN